MDFDKWAAGWQDEPDSDSGNYDIDYDELDRNDSYSPYQDVNESAQKYKDFQSAYNSYKQAKSDWDIYSGGYSDYDSAKQNLDNLEQNYKQAENAWKQSANNPFIPDNTPTAEYKSSEDLNGTSWQDSFQMNPPILTDNDPYRAKSSTELHGSESMAGNSYSAATNPFVPNYINNPANQTPQALSSEELHANDSMAGNSMSRSLADNQQKPNFFADEVAQANKEAAAEPIVEKLPSLSLPTSTKNEYYDKLVDYLGKGYSTEDILAAEANNTDFTNWMKYMPEISATEEKDNLGLSSYGDYAKLQQLYNILSEDIKNGYNSFGYNNINAAKEALKALDEKLDEAGIKYTNERLKAENPELYDYWAKQGKIDAFAERGWKMIKGSTAGIIGDVAVSGVKGTTMLMSPLVDLAYPMTPAQAYAYKFANKDDRFMLWGGKNAEPMTVQQWNNLDESDLATLRFYGINSVEDFNGAIAHANKQMQGRNLNFDEFEYANKEVVADVAPLREYKNVQNYEALYGASKFEQFVLQQIDSGVGMAFDAFLNFALPGSGLAGMALRVGGESYAEAIESGADDLHATLYMLFNVATEVGSEVIGGDTFTKAVYGTGGLFNESIDQAIAMLPDNFIQRFAKIGVGAFEEGIEEDFAQMFEPLSKALLESGQPYWDTVIELYGEQRAEEYAQAFLGGAFMSLLGGAAVDTGSSIANHLKSFAGDIGVAKYEGYRESLPNADGSSSANNPNAPKAYSAAGQAVAALRQNKSIEDNPQLVNKLYQNIKGGMSEKSAKEAVTAEYQMGETLAAEFNKERDAKQWETDESTYQTYEKDLRNARKGQVILGDDNQIVGDVIQADQYGVVVKYRDTGETDAAISIGQGLLNSDSRLAKLLKSGEKFMSKSDAAAYAAKKAPTPGKPVSAESTDSGTGTVTKPQQPQQPAKKAPTPGKPASMEYTDSGTGTVAKPQPKAQPKSYEEMTDEELQQAAETTNNYILQTLEGSTSDSQSLPLVMNQYNAIMAEIDKRRASGEERAEKQGEPPAPKAAETKQSESAPDLTVRENPDGSHDVIDENGEIVFSGTQEEAADYLKNRGQPETNPAESGKEGAKALADITTSEEPTGKISDAEQHFIDNPQKPYTSTYKESTVKLKKNADGTYTVSMSRPRSNGKGWTKAVYSIGTVNSIDEANKLVVDEYLKKTAPKALTDAATGKKPSTPQKPSESSVSASLETDKSVSENDQKQPQTPNEMLNTGSETKQKPVAPTPTTADKQKAESREKAREEKAKKEISDEEFEDILNELGIGEDSPNVVPSSEYRGQGFDPTKPLTKEQLDSLDAKGIIKRLGQWAKHLGTSKEKYSLIRNIINTLTGIEDDTGKDYSREISFIDLAKERLAKLKNNAKKTEEEKVEKEKAEFIRNNDIIDRLSTLVNQWGGVDGDYGDQETLYQACRYFDISSVRGIDQKADTLFESLKPALKLLGFKRFKNITLGQLQTAIEKFQDEHSDDSYLDWSFGEEDPKLAVSDAALEEIFSLIDKSKDINVVTGQKVNQETGEIESDESDVKTLFESLTGGEGFYSTESEHGHIAGVARQGDYESDLNETSGWKKLPRKVQAIILHALDAASKRTSTTSGGRTVPSTQADAGVLGSTEQEATRDTLKGLLNGTLSLETGEPITTPRNRFGRSKAVGTFYGDMNRDTTADRMLPSNALVVPTTEEAPSGFTIDDVPEDVQRIMRRVLDANADTLAKLEGRAEYYQLSKEAQALLPDVISGLDYWIDEDDGTPQDDWQALSRFLNGTGEWALGTNEFGDINAIRSAFALRQEILEFLYPDREFRFDSDSRTLQEVFPHNVSNSQYNESDWGWFRRNLGSILKNWKDAYSGFVETLMPESKAKANAKKHGKELNARSAKVEGLNEKYFYNIGAGFFRTIAKQDAITKAQSLINRHRQRVSELETALNNYIYYKNQMNLHSGQAVLLQGNNEFAQSAFDKAIRLNEELIQEYTTKMNNLRYAHRGEFNEDTQAKREHTANWYESQIEEARQRIEQLNAAKNNNSTENAIFLGFGDTASNDAYKQLTQELEEEQALLRELEDGTTKISDIWSNKFDDTDKRLIAGLDNFGLSSVKSIANAKSLEGAVAALNELAAMDKHDRWTHEVKEQGTHGQYALQPVTENYEGANQTERRDGSPDGTVITTAPGERLGLPAAETPADTGNDLGTGGSDSSVSGTPGGIPQSTGRVTGGRRGTGSTSIVNEHSDTGGRRSNESGTGESVPEGTAPTTARRLRRFKDRADRIADWDIVKSISSKLSSKVKNRFSRAKASSNGNSYDALTKLSERLTKDGIDHDSYPGAVVALEGRRKAEDVVSEDKRVAQLIKRASKKNSEIYFFDGMTEVLGGTVVNPGGVNAIRFENGILKSTIYSHSYDNAMHEIEHSTYANAAFNSYSGGHTNADIPKAKKAIEPIVDGALRQSFVEAGFTEQQYEQVKAMIQKAYGSDAVEEMYVELAGRGFNGSRNGTYSTWHVGDVYFDDIAQVLRRGSDTFNDLVGAMNRESDAFIKKTSGSSAGEADLSTLSNSIEEINEGLDFGQGMDKDPYVDASEEAEFNELMASIDRERDRVGLGDVIRTKTWTDKDGKVHSYDYSAEGLSSDKARGGMVSNARQRYQNQSKADTFNNSQTMQEARMSADANAPTATKRTASDVYGSAEDRVQEAEQKHKKNMKRSIYGNSQRYYNTFGKTNATMRNFRQIQELNGKLDGLFSGKTSFYDFNAFAKNMSSRQGIGQILNDDVQQMLDKAVMLEEEANGKDPNSEEVKEFQYHAARTISKVVARMAMVEETERNVANLTALARESGRQGKSNIIKNAVQLYNRMQISGDNFWRMTGNWDATSRNQGYVYAQKHNRAIANRIYTEAKWKNCFAGIEDTKQFRDLATGKTKCKTKIDGHEISLMQGIKFVKSVDTMLMQYSPNGKPDWRRAASCDGFALVDEKGNKSFVDIQGGYGKDFQERIDWLKSKYDAIKAEIESNKAASDYMKACEEMYFQARGDVDKVFTKVNGYQRTMYGKGYYTNLKYTTKENPDFDWRFADRESTDVHDTASVQERTKDHGGYVVINPMSQSVDSYISQMSNYVAFEEFAQELGIMTDSKSTNGSYTNVVNEAYGNQYGKWFENYVKTMSLYRENIPTKFKDRSLAKARQLMMQGALVGSVSVPIKQVSSYWASMAVLDPRAVRNAYRGPLHIKGNGIKNALVDSRKQSYGDPDVAEALNNGWLNKLKRSGRLGSLIANATNIMDSRTVANVYTAACLDVEYNSGLKPEQLYKNGKNYKDGLTTQGQFLVDSKFEEALLATQPIFTPQARNELARTDNQLLRMLSTFRTQQTQNYNRLLQATNEAYAANKYGGNKKAAGKQLRDTIHGNIISAASIAALSVLSDILLHKLRKYKDDEDKYNTTNNKVDPMKMLGRWGLNSVEALAGTGLFVGDLTKFVYDKLNKQFNEDWTPYSSKEFMGLSSGALGNAYNIIKSAAALYKDINENDGKKILQKSKALAGNIATASGIPLNNAYSLLNAGVQWIAAVDGSYEGVLKPLNGRYGEDIFKELDHNRTDKGNAIYNALAKGNEDKALSILAEAEGGQAYSWILYEGLDRLKAGKIDKDEFAYNMATYANSSDDQIDKILKGFDTGYSQYNGTSGQKELYTRNESVMPDRKTYDQIFEDISNKTSSGDYGYYYYTWDGKQTQAGKTTSAALDVLTKGIHDGTISKEAARVIWTDYYLQTESKNGLWRYIRDAK